MALKPADGTVAQQVCRVCGGEVNPHGECVVCGTKQDAPVMADKGLPTWLKTESGEATPWLNAPGTGDSRDEALRKWLSGEDTAYQDWIGVPTTSGGALTARATPDRMSDDKVRELRSKAMEVDGMRAELESMRATLNRELSNFRQGKFDPVKYIEETATLSKQLQTEIAKRKELEQEIEHIKKGSIAVIKYVKTQQLKAGTSPEMKKRLEQEQKLREEIETESAKLRSVNEVLKKQIESGFAKLKPDQRDMKRREADLMEREAALRGKEERIAAIHPDEVNAPTERRGRALPREARPAGAAQGRGGAGAGGLDRGARHEGPPRGTEVPDQPEGGGGADEGEVPPAEDGGAPDAGARPDHGRHRGPGARTPDRGQAAEGQDRHPAPRRPHVRRHPLRDERFRVRPRVRRKGGAREPIHGGRPQEGRPGPLGADRQGPGGRPGRHVVRPPGVRGIREARPGPIYRRVLEVDGRRGDGSEHDLHRRSDGPPVDPEGRRDDRGGVEEEVPDVPPRIPERVHPDRLPGPHDDVQVPPAVRRAPEAGQGRRLLRHRERDARGAGDPDARLPDGRQHRVQGRTAQVVPEHQRHLRRPEPWVDPVYVHEVECERRVVQPGPHQVIVRPRESRLGWYNAHCG